MNDNTLVVFFLKELYCDPLPLALPFSLATPRSASRPSHLCSLLCRCASQMSSYLARWFRFLSSISRWLHQIKSSSQCLIRAVWSISSLSHLAMYSLTNSGDGVGLNLTSSIHSTKSQSCNYSIYVRVLLSLHSTFLKFGDKQAYLKSCIIIRTDPTSLAICALCQRGD
jgi:hypothetical protein